MSTGMIVTSISCSGTCLTLSIPRQANASTAQRSRGVALDFDARALGLFAVARRDHHLVAVDVAERADDAVPAVGGIGGDGAEGEVMPQRGSVGEFDAAVQVSGCPIGGRSAARGERGERRLLGV